MCKSWGHLRRNMKSESDLEKSWTGTRKSIIIATEHRNWRQGGGVLGWVWVHCPNPHTVPRNYEMPTHDMQVCMYLGANVAPHAYVYPIFGSCSSSLWRSAEGMTYLQQVLAALRFMMAFLRSKDFHQLLIACWFFHCFLNHFFEGSLLSFLFENPFCWSMLSTHKKSWWVTEVNTPAWHSCVKQTTPNSPEALLQPPPPCYSVSPLQN